MTFNRRKFIRKATEGSIGITLSGALPLLYVKNSLIDKGSIGISAAFIGEQSVKGTKFDWLDHARIFIIDGFTYPLTPKIEFDAERLAETMVDMYANVLRIATSGFCDWMIPGTEFKVANDLGNRDILAECIAACKPRGIKVVPYLRTGGPIQTGSMKPEWARIESPRGDIKSYWDLGVKASTFCWNTPYRQAFYDYVKILVSKYDIDGMYFDAWGGYGFGKQICYCEGCKKRFKEFSKEDLPYKEKSDEYTSEELKILDRYREWCQEELFETFSETNRIIKSYKDIPLINNINNPESFSNRSPKNMRVINETNAFLYERGKSMIERAEGISVATAHGFIVWPYIGTYDPFPRIPHFKYELVQEIFTTIAFGGSPILYHTYFFVDHPKSRELIKEAFKIIDENNESYKGFRSDEFCAVIWNNTDPVGHPVSGYLWSVNARLSSLGSFSACIKNHIQTTSLLKQDLESIELISKYKVIYLPDICNLTDKQITNIKSFVENGGGLVITYSTSLYDENGNRRSDFALGDLARIRYHKPDERMSQRMNEHSTFGSVWDLYLRTRPGQEVIKSPLSDGLIPTHVYETVDVLPGGTIIADLVSGHEKDPIAPGLIVSHYGKGKVAYISSAMGAMYLQTGIKEFSDFLMDVIDYVSPDGLPYEIEAPHSTLITNMTVNGNKRVFHLINWTGSQSEKMWQNIYHIPAIENVTIKFKIPTGKKIKKVTSFIPIDFSQIQMKNVLHISLPRVEKYQGIVIELG